MEVELLLQIQKKYQKCPFCGSNYSKEKDVFSIHEDGIFERKCMCGYEISGHIDINGIIEKDYNESCAKNDFLMELKEGSLLHNDARGLLIQYPSVGNLSDAPLYIQKDKNFCKQLYTAAAGYKGRGSDVPSAFSREELTDKDERKQLLKGILQRGEIEKFSYDEVLQAVAELEDEEADY